MLTILKEIIVSRKSFLNLAAIAMIAGLASAAPIAAADADVTEPQFTYDVNTGVMRVIANGHFISDIVVPGLGVEGGLPTSLLPEGQTFNSRGGLVLWSGDYFVNKFSAFDGTRSGMDGEYDLAQWDTGLTAADFGEVEWGGRPIVGQPGESGFADVTIVPEPATMALLALGGMVIALRRRRGKA